MKNLCMAIIFIVLTSTFVGASTLDNMSKSTLLMTDSGGSATCFAVKNKESLFIVTAGHVLAGALADGDKFSNVYVRLNPSFGIIALPIPIPLYDRFSRPIFVIDEVHDVAVIAATITSDIFANAILLSDIMSESEILANQLIGNDVFVLGFPKKRMASKYYHPIVRKGIICFSAEEISDENNAFASIDVPIYQGMSGGPTCMLVDGKIKVIGIAIAMEAVTREIGEDILIESLHIGIMTYSSYAKKLIRESEVLMSLRNRIDHLKITGE